MSEFDGMTRDDLACDIDAYFRNEGQKSAAQAVPLPVAANRAALTQEQQTVLFENWVEHIYSSPPQFLECRGTGSNQGRHQPGSVAREH